MLKRNKILLLGSLVIIFSLLISMSALAFEVDFDGSVGSDYDVVETAFATVHIPAATAENWAPIMTADPVYPSIPDVTAVATAVATNARPDFTQMPEGTAEYNTGIATNNKDNVEPALEPAYVEGANELSQGYSCTYVVYIRQPLTVKAGAISVDFDEEIFVIQDMYWSLNESPLISGTDPEQRNAVFAYSEPTQIEGSFFYVNLYVRDTASYTQTHIAFDIILKDEEQNDIEINDPEMSVYIGCQNHYFDQIKNKYALARPATCHSYAEYYYSCVHCGMNDIHNTFVDYEGGYAEHSISDAWHMDEESHWHGCDTCSEMNSDMGKHSFGKWLIVKEATKEEVGIRECSCTVCGFTKSEPVKYRPATSAGNAGDADETEAPETTAAATTTAATTAAGVSITVNGCGASVSLGAIAVLPVLAFGAMLVKKKED